MEEDNTKPTIIDKVIDYVKEKVTDELIDKLPHKLATPVELVLLAKPHSDEFNNCVKNNKVTSCVAGSVAGIVTDTSITIAGETLISAGIAQFPVNPVGGIVSVVGGEYIVNESTDCSLKVNRKVVQLLEDNRDYNLEEKFKLKIDSGEYYHFNSNNMNIYNIQNMIENIPFTEHKLDTTRNITIFDIHNNLTYNLPMNQFNKNIINDITCVNNSLIRTKTIIDNNHNFITQNTTNILDINEQINKTSKEINFKLGGYINIVNNNLDKKDVGKLYQLPEIKTPNLKTPPAFIPPQKNGNTYNNYINNTNMNGIDIGGPPRGGGSSSSFLIFIPIITIPFSCSVM